MARFFLVMLACVAAAAAAPNHHSKLRTAFPDTLWPLEKPVRVWGHPSELYTPPETGMTGGSGFLMDMLAEFTKLTGIEFIVTVHPELAALDRPNDDGTWDSTYIGALVDKKCDMVGVDVTVNSDAEKVIDFLTPIMPYKLQVISNSKFGSPFEDPLPQWLIEDTHDLTYLKRSKNDTIRHVYESIDSNEPESLVNSVADGITKIVSGNYAMVVESNFVQGGLRDAHVDPTLVVVDPADLGKYFYNTFAVQLGSVLRQDLDVALEFMNEHGTINKLLMKAGHGLEL